MSEFYILDSKFSKGDVFSIEYKAPESYEKARLGIPIAQPKKPAQLFFKSKTARKTDLVAGIHSFPVVSSPFKSLLNELKVSHLEFHPVQLVCTKTDEADPNYHFLNILDNIPCIDREKSVLETLPDTDIVISVKKLYIKEETLGGRDLARIAELRSIILASTRLLKAVEKANLTGIAFQSVEEFKTLA